MKQIYRFLAIGLLINVSACASMQHLGNQMGDDTVETVQKPKTAVHQQPSFSGWQGGEVDVATVMSNENVIVYPIDGEIDAQRLQFPEYRGVVDNTTAGGYTVFDPSVIVYAVEGGAVKRPSYLPEYSVPEFPQPRMKKMKKVNNEPLIPVPLGRDYGDGIISMPLNNGVSKQPRMPRLTRAGSTSQPMRHIIAQPPTTRQTQNGRRSRPVLTGY